MMCTLSHRFAWSELGLWVVVCGVMCGWLGGVPALADQDSESCNVDRPLKSSPDFDRIKSLVGTWTGTTKHSGETKPVQVIYQLTAGGSAVMETVFQGTPHEMLTVYHLDDDRLVMTHYCMLGNQPRMESVKDEQPDVIQFSFVDGHNISPDTDPYMGRVMMKFDGDDQLISDWTLIKDGQPADVAHLVLKRQQP